MKSSNYTLYINSFSTVVCFPPWIIHPCSFQPEGETSAFFISYTVIFVVPSLRQRTPVKEEIVYQSKPLQNIKDKMKTECKLPLVVSQGLKPSHGGGQIGFSTKEQSVLHQHCSWEEREPWTAHRCHMY